MEIRKAAQAHTSGAPTAMQLEQINALAKTRLNGEQVYVFSLRLCDDQIDRDGSGLTPPPYLALPSCSSARPASLTTSGARTIRLPGFSRPRW